MQENIFYEGGIHFPRENDQEFFYHSNGRKEMAKTIIIKNSNINLNMMTIIFAHAYLIYYFYRTVQKLSVDLGCKIHFEFDRNEFP